MPYRVMLTRTVAEKIVHCPPEVKKRFKSSFGDIADHPYAGKALQEDLSGFYAYRFGRYRIIYKPDDPGQMITVYMVGHRRDIYELFSEHLTQSPTI